MAINCHTPTLSFPLVESALGCDLTRREQYYGVQGTQNTPWGPNLISLIMMHKASSYC